MKTRDPTSYADGIEPEGRLFSPLRETEEPEDDGNAARDIIERDKK
jgi:hypothetical protein